MGCICSSAFGNAVTYPKLRGVGEVLGPVSQISVSEKSPPPKKYQPIIAESNAFASNDHQKMM